MDTRTKRIQKELTDIERDSSSGVTAEPINDKLTHLIGRFRGPEGTPYEGGAYVVDIVVPEDYPFVPLKVRFETRVWHPNVSSQTVG
ncbi:UBC-like protein [Ascodesmis nigricans]|uniref:UBC-like protein n=1 Tax=Ascodesmis nigricans TaxID=341454 RepID=A0A4S2MIU2_9PEZI|nr:UBC-like protein [Ascodesmis nigricans]